MFAIFHITVFGILPIPFQSPATVFVGIDDGCAFAVYQVGERIFHRKGNRFLQYDGVTVFGYFTAIFHNEFFGIIRSAFHRFVERVVGVNERFVSDFFDSFSILLGERAESFDDTQNSQSVGRVAVGVLSAAGGYFQCLVYISFSIEQSYNDVGSVQFGIDIVFRAGVANVRASPLVF